jgi:hypothetical protein
MLRVIHCLDNRLIDGGKVVSPHTKYILMFNPHSFSWITRTPRSLLFLGYWVLTPVIVSHVGRRLQTWPVLVCISHHYSRWSMLLRNVGKAQISEDCWTVRNERPHCMGTMQSCHGDLWFHGLPHYRQQFPCKCCNIHRTILRTQPPTENVSSSGCGLRLRSVVCGTRKRQIVGIAFLFEQPYTLSRARGTVTHCPFHLKLIPTFTAAKYLPLFKSSVLSTTPYPQIHL